MQRVSYEFVGLLAFWAVGVIPSFFDTKNFALWLVLRIVFWGGAMAIFLFSTFFKRKQLLSWWNSLEKRTCRVIFGILVAVVLAELLIWGIQHYTT